MSSVVSSSANASQGPNARQSARQTRTNPSRTSKTLGRSSFAYGHSSAIETPPTPTPHGFYPALTHFTDAITALPREFRRHNSLLKEVDAKAWALEDNLLQLLKMSSESQPLPCPPNPAPIVEGVVRDDIVLAAPSQTPESQESKHRRLLFDRVRRNLVDLMMTADEKNHVISNANDELDRQLLRIDGIFPFIAGEIGEDSRLGSLTHWAYSNRNTAKTVTNERPRRETASNKQDFAHAGHEAEGSHRGEARRDGARKQRRTHADSDFDDARTAGSRKGQAGKARGGAGTAPGEQSALGAQGSGAGTSAATKRRKAERPPPVDTGVAAMERSASGTGNTSARGASKDATGEATKKRPRAPNPNAVARKRNNTGASAANSPILAPAPLAGAASLVRTAASPGPGTVRPQSSRAQQSSGPSANGRQRPSSSASNRLANTHKTTDAKTAPKETPKVETAPLAGITDTQRRETGVENAVVAGAGASVTAAKAPVAVSMKREDTETRPTELVESRETPIPVASNAAPKGRSSKTATPVLATFAEANTQRTRLTRNVEPTPAKRSHKKNGSVAVVQARAASEEEESLHEGDDEDEDGEPRYCYCNEISFGEMVACDNDACPREWFHLSCVGLTKPPGKNVKWYCNECKENMRRGRNGR